MNNLARLEKKESEGIVSYQPKKIHHQIKEKDSLHNVAILDRLKRRDVCETCDYSFQMSGLRDEENSVKTLAAKIRWPLINSSGPLIERLHFYFVINQSDLRTSSDFFEIQCEALKKLKCLKTLDMTLVLTWKPSEEYFFNLGRSLQKMTSLRSIMLSFSTAAKITTEGLEIVGLGLRKLPFLQNLEITFAGCDGEIMKGIFRLSQSLKSSRSLQSVYFNFFRCRDTLEQEGVPGDQGVCLRSLEFLKHLNLKVADYGNMANDQCFENMSTTLKQMHSLESVSLKFHGYVRQVEITDESLRHLGEGFSEIKSLKKLKLDFENCEKVTSQGLESLSQGIKKLKSLLTFHLIFKEHSTIDNKGSYAISKLLLELPMLKTLTCDFTHCNKIGEAALNRLAQNLKSHDSLGILISEVNLQRKVLKTLESQFRQFLTCNI